MPSLFVGGTFTTLDGRLANNVARLDDPCAHAGMGNVNAGAGEIVNVLFVNDSPGDSNRRLDLQPFEPIRVEVSAPPLSTLPAPYAMFLWTAAPNVLSSFPLPKGVGVTWLPTPLSGAPPRPAVVWNNTGRQALGFATRPSTPAPSRLFRLPSGAGRAISFYLQGVIVDPGSAAPVPASVTNGVFVEIR